MLRYIGILVVALLGSAGSSVAAADQYEPNDGQSQATPIVGGTLLGSIDTTNDEDWYALYPAGPVQLVVTLSNTQIGAPAGPCRGEVTDMEASLRSSTDEQFGSGSSDKNETTQIKSTISGTSPYYIRVIGRFTSDCAVGPQATYSLTVEPASGLTTKPCFDAMTSVETLRNAVARTRKLLKRARRPGAKARLRRLLAKQKRQLAAAQGSEASACA